MFLQDKKTFLRQGRFWRNAKSFWAFVVLVVLVGALFSSGQFIGIEEENETKYPYDDSSYFLNSKKDKIYFCEPFDMTCIPLEVHDADISTFEPLDNFWARDKSTLYYYGRIISNIDPFSFEIIAGAFVKDKNNVFFFSKEADLALSFGSSKIVPTEIYKKIPTLDPSTFSIIKDLDREYRYRHDPVYIKDKQQVYFFVPDTLQEIPNVDASSFEKIGFGYFKDRSNVYYENFVKSGSEKKVEMKVVADASPDTFQVIPDAPYDDYMKFEPGTRAWRYLAMGKDKKNFFVKDKKVYGIARESFIVLANRYAKDKNFVYFTKNDELVPLRSADPNTFKVVDCGFYSDSCGEDFNGKWQESKKVDFFSKPHVP